MVSYNTDVLSSTLVQPVQNTSDSTNGFYWCFTDADAFFVFWTISFLWGVFGYNAARYQQRRRRERNEEMVLYAIATV